MSDNQERVVTLTTTELLNFAAHNVTQEHLNDTRKELDAKIESVRTEVQAVRVDLTNNMNNMFYKLVFLMLGTVGGLFGGMIYILNNFYHLQP